MGSNVAWLLKADARFADKYVVSRGGSESSPFRCCCRLHEDGYFQET